MNGKVKMIFDPFSSIFFSLSDLNFCLLFGGTDGQDGTDAAGAILSSTDIIDMSPDEIEEAEKALLKANSYNFWKDFKGAVDQISVQK